MGKGHTTDINSVDTTAMKTAKAIGYCKGLTFINSLEFPEDATKEEMDNVRSEQK